MSTKPIRAYGKPAELREVKRRAGLHGLSVSAYLLRCALGRSLGDATGNADDWWDSLTPRRKEQLRRWQVEGGKPPAQNVGQAVLPLEDAS